MQYGFVAAYTASMHHALPTLKHLACISLIALASVLTSGCCTPGSYYEQPVNYVPQTSYYTPTYSYPVYNPVIVPIQSPRYSWGTPCPPPIWHRSYHREERSCHDRSPRYSCPQVASRDFCRKDRQDSRWQGSSQPPHTRPSFASNNQFTQPPQPRYIP